MSLGGPRLEDFKQQMAAQRHDDYVIVTQPKSLDKNWKKGNKDPSFQSDYPISWGEASVTLAPGIRMGAQGKRGGLRSRCGGRREFLAVVILAGNLTGLVRRHVQVRPQMDDTSGLPCSLPARQVHGHLLQGLPDHFRFTSSRSKPRGSKNRNFPRNGVGGGSLFGNTEMGR